MYYSAAPQSTVTSVVSASSWGTIDTTVAGPRFIKGVNEVIAAYRCSVDLAMLTRLASEKLAEPAFSPPLVKATLFSGPRPWHQTVENTHGLTVQDVLTGVFWLFYHDIDQSDMVGHPSEVVEQMQQKARSRAASNPQGGIRFLRCDLLHGGTRFSGIEWDPSKQAWKVLMK